MIKKGLGVLAVALVAGAFVEAFLEFAKFVFYFKKDIVDHQVSEAIVFFCFLIYIGISVEACDFVWNTLGKSND